MPASKNEQARLTTAAVLFVAFVAAAALLYYTRSVMIPFVLAVFIVSIVSPVVDVLVLRFRFPRIIAVSCALVLVLITVSLFSLLIAYSAQQIARSAGRYIESLLEFPEQLLDEEGGGDAVAAAGGGTGDAAEKDALQDAARSDLANPTHAPDAKAAATGSAATSNTDPAEDAVSTTPEQGAAAADEEEESHGSARRPGMQQVLDSIDPYLDDLKKSLPGLAAQSLGTAVNILSTVFFVVIFVIFLLSGRDPRRVHTGIYAEIDRKIRRYIATKVALSAVTGTLVAAVLIVFDLELAVVFGVLAFMLNFIPSVGSVIATLLPIPIAVAQFNDPWTIVGVIAIPGTIQIVIGNGIEPKLMGEGLELHPVIVVLSLAFWGLLWGPIGAILAVPITAVLRIVLMRFETCRPVGEMMAGRLPGATSETREA